MKMMDNDTPTDAGLDALFDRARAAPPVVPDALMARVLADAAAAQPVRGGSRAGWRRWVAALGGAPALGGLVTASCLGFWLGFAPPDTLPDVAGQVWGVETVVEDDSWDGIELIAFGWDIEEG